MANAGSPVITTQRTGKDTKTHIVIAIAIGAIGAFVRQYNTEWGATLILIAIGWYGVAKIMSWWSYD